MNLTYAMRSNTVVFFALILALAAQLPHAARLFALHERADGPLVVAQAIAYALALDGATLICVMRGRVWAANVFATVSAATNLLWYNPQPALTTDTAAAVVMALALPAAIAFYSHEIKRVEQDESAHERAGSEQEAGTGGHERAESQYACPQCERTFASPQARAAHMRFCARKERAESGHDNGFSEQEAPHVLALEEL